MERIVATSPSQSSVSLGAGSSPTCSPGRRTWTRSSAATTTSPSAALFECQRRGIRVPDDLSIIGFNDLEFCASTFPSLTSVATPRYEMARRAAEIILEIIRGTGERPGEAAHRPRFPHRRARQHPAAARLTAAVRVIARPLPDGHRSPVLRSLSRYCFPSEPVATDGLQAPPAPVLRRRRRKRVRSPAPRDSSPFRRAR